MGRRILKWYRFDECVVQNNHGKEVKIEQGIHSVADDADLVYASIYLNDRNIDISHEQLSILKASGKAKLIKR